MIAFEKYIQIGKEFCDAYHGNADECFKVKFLETRSRAAEMIAADSPEFSPVFKKIKSDQVSVGNLNGNTAISAEMDLLFDFIHLMTDKNYAILVAAYVAFIEQKGLENSAVENAIDCMDKAIGDVGITNDSVLDTLVCVALWFSDYHYYRNSISERPESTPEKEAEQEQSEEAERQPESEERTNTQSVPQTIASQKSSGKGISKGGIVGVIAVVVVVVIVVSVIAHNKSQDSLTDTYVAENEVADVDETGIEENDSNVITFLDENDESEVNTTSNDSVDETLETEDTNQSVEGIIFPNSSEERLSESDVQALSDEDLQHAINEILARHGYQFVIKTEYNDFYYGSGAPYEGVAPNDKEMTEISDTEFNAVEKYNYLMLADERDTRKEE